MRSRLLSGGDLSQVRSTSCTAKLSKHAMQRLQRQYHPLPSALSIFPFRSTSVRAATLPFRRMSSPYVAQRQDWITSITSQSCKPGPASTASAALDLVHDIETGFQVVDTNKPGRVKVFWSRAAAAKLGSRRWKLYVPGSLRRLISQEMIAAAAKAMDRHIAGNQRSGLSALTSAVSSASEMLLAGNGALPLLLENRYSDTSVYCQRRRDGMIEVIQSTGEISFTLKGVSPAVTLSCSIASYCFVSCRTLSVTQDDGRLTVRHEHDFFRAIARMAASSLSQEMRFTDQLTATKTLAEVALRVIFFKTPGFKISSLTVRTSANGDRSTIIAASAKWSDHDQDAVEVSLLDPQQRDADADKMNNSPFHSDISTANRDTESLNDQAGDRTGQTISEKRQRDESIAPSITDKQQVDDSHTSGTVTDISTDAGYTAQLERHAEVQPDQLIWEKEPGHESYAPGPIADLSTSAQPPTHLSGRPSSPVLSPPSRGRACIALGSNLGDKIGNIEAACRLIDSDPDMQILETSSLYETKPMYVEDQDSFVNGVCIIQSNISPVELLDRLQNIEKTLGRVKLLDKGPRSIDLDIVSFGHCNIQTDRLAVPHALMQEREFVLRPMMDTSHHRWVHPRLKLSTKDLYANVPKSGPRLEALTAVGWSGQYLRPCNSLKRHTYVMSILNATPDSFSDGGLNEPSDVDSLTGTIRSHIVCGAQMLDVGGQSSRPNAASVTAEEEIERILPVIHAIKGVPEAAGVLISVDTYRAKVAEAAVAAGAHIVNDISAGLLDPEMLPTIARLGCTYVMMHMRGTPATMQNDDHTTYPDGLLLTIRDELIQRLDAADAAGIRRWRIILDPGIGFAKTTQQNLEILKANLVKTAGARLRSLPWLVGTSRKSFIGAITGVEDPKDRVGGTAATVVAAIRAGASIVRVHDVKIMAQVAKMTDAFYF